MALKFFNNEIKQKKRGPTKLGTALKTVNRVRKKYINVLKNTFTVKKHKNCFQSKIDTFIGITIFSQGTRMVTYFAGLKKTKSGVFKIYRDNPQFEKNEIVKISEKNVLENECDY